MATGARGDPYLSFRFTVEIGGHVVAGFSEVSGLALETEVETFREGGVNHYEWQLAGATKFASRLVLKRGLGDIDALWAWHQKIAGGNIERKDVSILLLSSAGEEQRRWGFLKACPVKWTGPELRAGSAEIAFESVELVHQGLLPMS